MNLSELNEEIAFTESFSHEKSRILENMLGLKSASQLFKLDDSVIQELRDKSETVRDNLDTSSISKEIVQGLIDSRRYHAMVKGPTTHTRSSFYAKIMNSQNPYKSKKQFPLSSIELALRPQKTEEKHLSWNNPYFFRNISNIYGELDIEKIHRKKVPKPSHPYFPDLELRRAIKLGQQVSKRNNNP